MTARAANELGKLALIDDAKRAAALALVKQGRMYDLGHVLDENVPVFPGRYCKQTLVTTAHHANEDGGVGENNVNWITELVSGTMQLGTHLDALSHLQMGDHGYGGFTVRELAGSAGVRHLGVETVYLVHGQAGEDPTEAWRSRAFPYPAVTHEPRVQQLADDFARAGHHPFHLPVGIDLNESDPEAGRCVRCDRFDGFPCLADGKADAHVRCVRPALAQHKNLELITHAQVERLETSRTPLRWSDATTWRTSTPGYRALADAEHHQVPEDARDQRLLLGRRGLRAPSGPHPNAGQV